jgi:hypothetical protein
MRSAQDTTRRKLGLLALALLVFALAAGDRYSSVIEAGVRQTIPSRAATARRTAVILSDQRFVVWAVSRNARTLASEPSRIYDAEQCFPAPRSLSLGEPVLTMGFLGIPAEAIGGDPVITYNVVMLLMSLLAAVAMYWLIVDWTGVAAAGVVAGLLYAFHGLAIHDPVHPYSSDTTWMVVALLFSRRLFAEGHWRDAVALSASVSMQLATSFYPFVAAGLIGIVFLPWLCMRYRLEHVRPAQLALAAAIALGAGAVVFGPYLQGHGEGVLAARTAQWFRPWADYGPSGPAFFGWVPAALVVAGLAVPARLSLARLAADPRPALVVAGLLVAAVAAGSSGTLGLDVYALLAAWAPGFDTVRIPWKISIGVHLVSSLIAGIGVAGLLALWRWPGRELAGGLVVVATLAALLFGPGRADPIARHIRPDEESLVFFEELAARGNDGPLFETPIPTAAEGFAWPATAAELLLSAYHHRPTSACYPSHPPAHAADFERIETQLPAPNAIAELGRLGFTTILVHHPNPPKRRERPVRSERGRAFQRLAERPNAPIRLVHENRQGSAYEIIR